MVSPAAVSGARSELPGGHGFAPLSVGCVVVAFVAAMVGGAAMATALHDISAAVAWLAGAGLCGGLFAFARGSTRRAPSGAGVAWLTALMAFTLSWLLVLVGESWTRAYPFGTRGPVGAGLLAVFLIAATGLPLALVVRAMRGQRNTLAARQASGPSPSRIAYVLGVTGVVATLVLTGLAAWASPPAWRGVMACVVAVASPAFLIPAWGWAYRRLLSRWEVPPPGRLVKSLEALRGRTGCAFGRVICLDAMVGGGRVCQVVTGPSGSTLLVSASIPDRLTSAQLEAILAHEAAHVQLGHLRRKVLFGAGAAIAAVAAAVALNLSIAPLLPRGIGVARVLVVVLPVVVLRALFDTFVVRRHEAEADAFAVEVSGAEPLIAALDALGGAGPPNAWAHGRWTTHGTWEERAARIRAAERLRNV